MVSGIDNRYQAVADSGAVRAVADLVVAAGRSDSRRKHTDTVMVDGYASRCQAIAVRVKRQHLSGTVRRIRPVVIAARIGQGHGSTGRSQQRGRSRQRRIARNVPSLSAACNRQDQVGTGSRAVIAIVHSQGSHGNAVWTVRIKAHQCRVIIGDVHAAVL
ncbi:hypothetical protein D9M72_345010 [compost metagenome]